MRLLRDGEAQRLGPCEWCGELLYDDEPHHWHTFKLTRSPIRGLYCEYCAVKAGWIPVPEGAQVDNSYRSRSLPT